MTFKATGQRPFPLPHAAEGAGLADCSGLNAQAKRTDNRFEAARFLKRFPTGERLAQSGSTEGATRSLFIQHKQQSGESLR